MADRKISICEANLLPGNEKCPNHDAVSASGTNGDSAGSIRPRSSVISTSTTSAEQTFESASIGYEHVSSKSCEISTLDVGKNQANHLKSDEDGFNVIVQVKQNKTESSCSDSSSGILPVSHSRRETLKRAGSFNNHSGSVSSSNSMGFHHRMEEPVTASSESGISAQVDHKASTKGRATNSMKAPLMIKNRNSFHGDVTIGKSSICSGYSKNFNSSTEMEQNIRSFVENDNHITFRSSENMLSVKGEPVNMDPKVPDGFLLHESSEFLMTKPIVTEVFARDENASVVGFDLNEDINTHELDDHEQSVVETVSFHNVIHVVAKAGVPRGRPMIPMKFEGGLGWKGSALTSAFSPISLLKSFDKNPCSSNFTGIDLNVAAVEDTPEIGFQDSCAEVGSRRAERIDIDLNCLCDDVDESPQSSIPAESGNPYLAYLDLNANTSGGETCNNVSQPSANSRGRDVNLSSVNVFNHAHAHSHMMAAPNVLKQIEEMHRVSPLLQPKLPHPLHMLPPRGFPSHGPPLYIGHMKPFMFNMQYPGAIPHHMEVAHGQSRGDITSSSHRIDVKNEDSSSRSGSKRDKAREFMLPAKISSLDENENEKSFNQEAWYAKLMKRKEPEGGWDYFHVGRRQVT